VCSMGDLFHEDVPYEWIDKIFAVMGRCQHHTFQVLTKRPRRMAEYLAADRYQHILNEAYKLNVPDRGMGQGISNQNDMRWWPNVHLGVTAENQKQADLRIPILLQIPAAVHFVSIEPMLGPVDIRPYLPYEIDSGGFDPQGFPISLGTRLGLNWVIVGAETGPGARTMDLNWARSVRDQCHAAGVAYFFKKDSQGRHTLDGRVWEQFPEVSDAK